MFMDASVILANLLDEPEASVIRQALSEEIDIATSAIAMFEASTRLAIVRRSTVDEAYEVVRTFVDSAKLSIVSIDAAVGAQAHACASRYHHLTGHPARLNLGDCFAYAAAQSSGLKLAYKGNDFGHTDVDGVRFGPCRAGECKYLTKTLLGALADGTPIHAATLRSAAGLEAQIVEWGASLRDLVVPLPGGRRQRVVLGLQEIADYAQHASHMGAIAGRYANRIGGGRFTLDSKAYQLPLNQDGRHSLHGGGQGFGKRPWTIVHHDAASVTLALVSPDGDAGYPGTLNVWCRYSLQGEATLRIELSATSDTATIVNLAHHSYFRLDDGPDILDHELEIRSHLMTPVDADLIPDGSLVTVAGTPFDFRKSRPIRHANADGSRVWYDHNFVLRRDRREPSAAQGLELAHAATLHSARGGLSMQLWTTEPALQVYDGFKLNTPVPGLDGAPYGACAGVALEPQHVPDSPNLPHCPTTVLRPGELYRQVSEYRFGNG